MFRARNGAWIGATALCASLLGASVAEAAPLTYKPNRVGDPVPNGCSRAHCTLREAVIAANEHPGPDRIVLRPGRVYGLGIAGEDEDDSLTGDLDVTGPLAIQPRRARRGRRARPATIDGGDVDRVLDQFDGAGRLVMRRLVIRDGKLTGSSANGGGIRSRDPLRAFGLKLIDNETANEGGGAEIEDGALFARSVIARNRSEDTSGALIVQSVAPVTIRGTRIVGNQSGDQAGVSYHSGGPLMIVGSLLKGNTAQNDGGAIENNDGSISIVRSSLIANRTTDDGGAVRSFGSLTVRRSVISRNVAGDGPGPGSGGGLANIGGTLSISTSTVSANRADDLGGGIFTTSFGPVSLTTVNRTTLSGNQAGTDGGGIENDADFNASVLSVLNSTVSNNSAGGFGGGIDSVNDAGTAVNDSTVARNRANADGVGAEGGGGLASDNPGFEVLNSLIALNSLGGSGSGPDCTGVAFISEGHNLISDSSGCTGFGGGGDQLDLAPKIRGLAANGGPTRTIALKPGSPAINQGGDGCTPRDQRGVRSFRRCDIGAFEFRRRAGSH